MRIPDLEQLIQTQEKYAQLSEFWSKQLAKPLDLLDVTEEERDRYVYTLQSKDAPLLTIVSARVAPEMLIKHPDWLASYTWTIKALS